MGLCFKCQNEIDNSDYSLTPLRRLKYHNHCPEVGFKQKVKCLLAILPEEEKETF